jgi:uncharacterized protein (UPF0548 family)
MKKTFTLMTFFFVLISFAGEVTGVGRQALQVLRQHNMSIAELRQAGLKVHLGEVTGVGKRIHLDQVEMVVSKNKVFKMRELSHVEFKNPSQARSLNDVVHLEFDRAKVRIKDIGAVVARE